MRLAVTKSGHYHADIYCAHARDARKLLREKPVSVLAIDFRLSGKETGDEILQWAHEHQVLPAFVVIVAREREGRSSLTKTLGNLGFRSSDNTTFFRR